MGAGGIHPKPHGRIWSFPLRKIIPTLLTAALVFSCESCRMGGPQGTTPDFVPTPTALSFSACPTRDESGGAVQDVFPDLKKLLIENRGNVQGELSMSISGAGASSFTIGSSAPTSIGRQETVEVPISFSPTAKGDVRAELTIDDKIDETMNQVVTLIGTGRNQPAQPTIETGPQKTDKSGFRTCTAETPLSECELAFPDTLMNQSATLQLKISNKGCPSLKITSIEIDGSTTPGTTDGFSLEGIAPSIVAPMVLSVADGTDETIVNIRFDAVDDGSGATSQTHFAVITLKSNDPVNGDGFANPARLTLTANAIKPSIYVSPTSCNYSNSMDNCGNAPRVANKASFRVSNDGSTPISISSVKFRSSGTTTSSDSRFSVTQNIQGQTIQPTASATIEVTEVDQPLLVADQLEIVSDIPGMGAGSGGNVVVSVISGIKPCMTTDPADDVDFGNPTEELTAKRIIIRNGASCGTLRLDGLSIISRSTVFYTFLDPQIPPGTIVPPGGMAETTVQYRRPPSGGTHTAELVIRSNDTDYGPPSYRVMILQSTTPLDTVPVANLTACHPAQLVNDPNCTMGQSTSASFNLSMINPDEITFSAANSTDDTTVTEYKFELLGGSPFDSSALANHNIRMTSNKTKFTIPAGGTGTFRVRLDVWDDRGQKSPTPSIITVNVYP
jgi:hypothetical protein